MAVPIKKELFCGIPINSLLAIRILDIDREGGGDARGCPEGPGQEDERRQPQVEILPLTSKHQ